MIRWRVKEGVVALIAVAIQLCVAGSTAAQEAATQPDTPGEPAGIAETEIEDEEVRAPGSESMTPPEQTSWRPWFAVLLHVSLVSDRLSASTLNIRLGYGITIGARRGPWGVYGHLEHNLWADTEYDFVARKGTLNLAIGGERFLFRERLRLAAAVGASVLLSDQALHSAPHLGLFVQLKPMGIRFARRSQVLIVLDPLSLTIVAPILGSPSLVDLQYRTTIGVEWQGVR